MDGFFQALRAQMDEQQLHGADRYVVMARELLKEQAAIGEAERCRLPEFCTCEECLARGLDPDW